MKKKAGTLLTMLFVLLALIVVYMVVLRQNEKAEEAEKDSYVVTDFEETSITSITYTYDGVTTRLQKEDGKWVNADDPSMELDQDKVAELITKVNSIQSQNQITGAEDLSEYGLDPAVVTVCLKSEETSYTILFGDYNDMIYQSYVALEGENVVYTTSKAKCSAFQEPVSALIIEQENETEPEE